MLKMTLNTLQSIIQSSILQTEELEEKVKKLEQDLQKAREECEQARMDRQKVDHS